MRSAALTVAVGLVSGVLSGQFGIGGGLITTPAIRLLLGYPALIAVGTPLPVILPTAIAGSVSYVRAHLADVRAGLVMGVVGGACSIAGAWLTRLAGGSTIMLATAVLIAWVAIDMARHVIRGGAEPAGEGSGPSPATPLLRLASVGVLAGLYSGFLGLGGGFVVVPALTRWLGWPMKRAIGTSLVTVAVLAVPGTVAHYVLGNIDPGLALWLAAGTVPGALVGARLTKLASERQVTIGFAVLLGVVAVLLGATELAGLL